MAQYLLAVYYADRKSSAEEFQRLCVGCLCRVSLERPPNLPGYRPRRASVEINQSGPRQGPSNPGPRKALKDLARSPGMGTDTLAYPQ
jgi:hypothetical protein